MQNTVMESPRVKLHYGKKGLKSGNVSGYQEKCWLKWSCNILLQELAGYEKHKQGGCVVPWEYVAIWKRRQGRLGLNVLTGYWDAM